MAVRRLKSLCSRARNDDSGATAVEFGILGPIFFVMIFSAIELGFVLTKVALLESAANEVAKQVYIGAAASGSVTKQDLEEQVCETMELVDSNCDGNLAIELTPIATYSSIPAADAKCVDKGDPIKPTVDFIPGAGNNIVYMRICLTTNILTPGLGFGLSLPKTDNGKLQIISALAFSNEPF